MSLILCIDTTSAISAVTLVREGRILSERCNEHQPDHAAFLHPAIQDILQESGTSLKELNAVSVCNGPGSYTGIRVGISSAKGLALALNIPLIMVDALTILAKDAIDRTKKPEALYCSMIDARRMEVFSAMYNFDLTFNISPSSLILDESTFSELEKEIVFAGSGSQKFQGLFQGKGVFLPQANTSKAFSTLSQEKFDRKNFSDLINSDAFYLKEFYDNKK